MTKSSNPWRPLRWLERGMLFFPLYAFALHKAGAPLIFQVGLLALGMLIFFLRASKQFRYFEISLCVATAALLFLFKAENLIRLYPFLMSMHFLLIFSFQDQQRTSFLEQSTERFKILTPIERASLKKTNFIWQVGLSINTAVLAAFLVGFSMEAWAFYAGVLSYGLLAVLFALTLSYISFARHYGNA